jgi:long-chain fatty acid transport protein
MIRTIIRVSLLTATCALAVSTGAQAAGFYLQEQSVSGLGTAFAGAAADTPDASTVYYNPAGMTTLKSPEIYFGGTLLLPRADFDNDGSSYTAPAGLGGGTSLLTGSDSGNPFDPAILPQLYGVLPVNDRIALGIGINAPFGLADKYSPGWVGRYNSTDSELKSISIQPSGAYKVNNWLSLGAGVDIQYVYANLKSHIPAPSVGAPNPANDGSVRLRGDDVSVGYNLGLQLYPTDTTKIGLTYKTAVNHELEGKVDRINPISGLLGGASGAFITGDGVAKLSLPDIASFAVSQQVDDKWTILGSVNYYGWSAFDSIPVGSSALTGGGNETPQNYENTWGFAVGARYRLNDQWLLKGGFQYDQTPTVTSDRSTRVPDGDRMWFAGGFTYSMTPQIDLDFSGAYVDVKEERVDVTDSFTFAPGVTATTNTRGESSGGVGIMAAAIKYKF